MSGSGLFLNIEVAQKIFIWSIAKSFDKCSCKGENVTVFDSSQVVIPCELAFV